MGHLSMWDRDSFVSQNKKKALITKQRPPRYRGGRTIKTNAYEKTLLDYSNTFCDHTLLGGNAHHVDARLNITKVDLSHVTFAVGFINQLSKGVVNRNVIQANTFDSEA